MEHVYSACRFLTWKHYEQSAYAGDSWRGLGADIERYREIYIT
jgi:hypothetical protein